MIKRKKFLARSDGGKRVTHKFMQLEKQTNQQMRSVIISVGIGAISCKIKVLTSPSCPFQRTDLSPFSESA